MCADLHIITYLNLTTSYSAVKHGDMLSGDSVTLKRHDLNVDQMLQLMASSCYGASLLSLTNVGEGTTRQSRSITIKVSLQTSKQSGQVQCAGTRMIDACRRSTYAMSCTLNESTWLDGLPA